MTERQLVERKPKQRSTIRLWLLLLAGPVLWAVHFMAVYLAAEASCTAQEEEPMAFIGPDALVVGVVAATVVAAAASLAAAWWAWGRARHSDGDEAAMGWGGVLTGIGGGLAIIAVGVPALVVGPC